mmetsp:Transcript_29389/g.52542  ORF Transcript_29389/g.52542 Transcript_29389/m.52542 type:complete len:686 (-) Transcript_29389:55-2112(-)|eukprot:CAMPEP_0177780544 /NCGR_PEP_ID=MMETSP0491_2-20121128/17269_1 /TAXON_ID=63592 /ORGANISM="Tetraselmis chuii, Strain PLY429" /LENGTH=685 /DNA_ID=CAMNT_0019300341 /DNA_START=212 /DNA_END=2269 /DNA_ORIENTATION=-
MASTTAAPCLSTTSLPSANRHAAGTRAFSARARLVSPPMHRRFCTSSPLPSTRRILSAKAVEAQQEVARADERSATLPTSDSERGGGGVSSGFKLENVSITFKNQQVLKDVSWDCKKGERVGLVGVNGAGKTTQLSIVTGKLTPDTGEVSFAKKKMNIAYLTQEFDVEPTRTVREEFRSVYKEQLKVTNRLDQLQKDLEQVTDDMERMQELLDEMDKLNTKATALNVDTLDAKIDRMMPELGFKPGDDDRLVASFSGGWQMRMCLGKILLEEPDLLLLDEPTNHLDIDAIEWLEGYLKTREVPMVIVSHDRMFLDQLCTKIVETELGVTNTYPGNYTQYVAAKERNTAMQMSKYDKQQKEMQRQRELIQRLSGGAQSGRAATAEKMLEKLQAEAIQKPFVAKSRNFRFPRVEKIGQKVLNLQGLTHGYNGRILFRDANLEVEKGERIAIIGPNGAGKSTLLRLIMGTEEAQEGRAELGEHNIIPNYFEQNQAEALDLEETVLGTLEKAAPDAKINDIKRLLGQMMFSGKAMEKQVKWLSGGEKARLALAKFMLTPATLLVLDEPTNHLDIPSKEMLEEAVRNFDGAVIAVSHDRYFLRQIVTRVLTVEEQQIVDYEGDYEYFLEKNEDEAERIEELETKQREVEKSNIVAKSKLSKAEKMKAKKEKAKDFNTGKKKGNKNAKRWN